jgi:hypothetical protein
MFEISKKTGISILILCCLLVLSGLFFEVFGKVFQGVLFISGVLIGLNVLWAFAAKILKIKDRLPHQWIIIR